MKPLTLLLSLGFFLLTGWLLWLTVKINNQPNIAYVKSIYLVENYMGTKEAFQVLQKKVVQWQANMDSLQYTYKESINQYKNEKDKLDKKSLENLEREIAFKQGNLEKYQQIIQQKRAEEDKKLTEGVYAQIDSYLKAYAKKQGYDIVIGANAEGTVLYGSDAFDITEDILTIINQQYKGEK